MGVTQEIGGEPPLKYQIVIALSIFIISVLGTWLSVVVTQSLTQLTPEANYLAFFRTLMIFCLLIILLPMSVAIEILLMKWKKRKISFMNIFLGGIAIGEAIITLGATSIIFETLFPDLSFTHEPFLGASGLILGLTIAIPLIIVGLTSRIPKVRKYIKKAYE